MALSTFPLPPWPCLVNLPFWVCARAAGGACADVTPGTTLEVTRVRRAEQLWAEQRSQAVCEHVTDRAVTSRILCLWVESCTATLRSHHLRTLSTGSARMLNELILYGQKTPLNMVSRKLQQWDSCCWTVFPCLAGAPLWGAWRGNVWIMICSVWGWERLVLSPSLRQFRSLTTSCPEESHRFRDQRSDAECWDTLPSLPLLLRWRERKIKIILEKHHVKWLLLRDQVRAQHAILVLNCLYFYISF